VYLAANIVKIIELTGCLRTKSFDEYLGGGQNKQGVEKITRGSS
jgi:hypothetical protein